LQESALGHL